MRYNIYIFFVVIQMITQGISAEIANRFQVDLQWVQPQSWKTTQSERKVLSFQDATYPTENYLPHYFHRIEITSSTSYNVKIDAPTYVNLTPEEAALLGSDHNIPSEIELKPYIQKDRNTTYLSVSILPFVKNDGVIQKLSSFSIIYNKNTIQKAPSVTQHTYSTSSVLAQGKFVKIKIENSGIHKLTYEELNSMGVTPANVRIFGYGGNVLDQDFNKPKNDDLPELSIYMNKGSDGIFNSGDYVLFYAQGINKWTYEKSRGMFNHLGNSYSKYGYYFVSSDAGIGKKIAPTTINVPTDATINEITEFTDYQVHEKELKSIAKSGKEFYGEVFTSSTPQNFTFNSPNIVPLSQAIVRLDVAASSTLTSSFSMSLDGANTNNLNVPRRSEGDNYELGKSASAKLSFLTSKDNLVFNLAYNSLNNTSIGYLNYIEVNTRRYLKMVGNAMQFQNVDYLGSATYNKYIISDANANVEIWDITNPQEIQRINTTNESGKLTFTDSAYELKTYLAIEPTVGSVFPKVEIMSQVKNQNLHGMSPVDFVIITHPDFKAQAEQLAQAHRDIDLMTVGVVTTEEVYNEFSSGTPDATAYRWMMKMLYDRAILANIPNDLPKYLLLFGRGSFDNRKILNDSGDNLVLTYQAENSLTITLSYVTDDYFGLLDNNEGIQIPSNLVDLGIGRFPVRTKQEAAEVVNKTIGYMQNKIKGNWKNQLCFLADDGDGALHVKQADSITSIIARNHPSYQIKKIFLDAYQQENNASGQSYPVARNEFQNSLRTGLFLLNYTGHAGYNGWTNEQILTAADVVTLSNKYLPLWIGATCDFLQYDVETVSAGEHVLTNPIGGGIGIFSAARPVYASQNMTINKLVCENLFKKENGEHLRVGDIIRISKNNVGSEINKLCYVYMGNPAMKLNYPTQYNVITTQINGSSTLGNDTLRATSINTLKGFISDNNSGELIKDFNGYVDVTIFDKIQRITTLNNENEFNGSYTFSYRPNKLFSGKTKVINGQFILTFMLPTDIKYNYGTGRINYYATDTITAYEGQGLFENFKVGGSKSNAYNDTEGPELSMYLNTNTFENGDKTNESPLFIGVVKDISGINRVGSGIGHDMLLTLDQNSKESYVLNDYFETEIGDYSKGIVKFKFNDLTEGKHTISFRVWDLLNNSTSKTIEFEVVKGLTPTIFSVSNYPNPARVSTNIMVVHDRPETILNTTIEVFDLAGRKIWSMEQSTIDTINWDLIASDNRKVKPGVYLYRVRITTNDTDVYSKINKLLVVE